MNLKENPQAHQDMLSIIMGKDIRHVKETIDEVVRQCKSPRVWEEKYYEREEGRIEEKKDLIKKKLAKGKSVTEIADALEESEETIRELMKEFES